MSTQSLPSFAQAFSTHGLRELNTTNALPPIMAVAGRKRSRTDKQPTDDDDPPPVRVKQEHDELDSDGDSNEPHDTPHLAHDHAGAPPPSSLMPSPLKKRRVTVSGAAPHPLRIDVRPNPDQTSSTPISPVVMGFTIQRDNPNAMEQVRSMISVKQKQKALIEQRRGSAAGIMSPVANAPPTPIDDHQQQQQKQQQRIPPSAASTKSGNNSSGPVTRASRRSPNTSSTTVSRRQQRAQTPPPPPVPPQPAQIQSQQQQQNHAPPTPQHSLPPPPISFARRRAALLGGKKKPADIVISPREAHTRDQFQPSIQSAPPIPQAGGQSGFYRDAAASRTPMMALPRLPTMHPGEHVRRVAGNVPPTPTRLSMLQQQQQQAQPVIPGNNPNSNNNTGGVAHRSPPASVPIASTLVPPTPTSLHRPGYAGDKSAFLAPFELFYDALSDSRQLKAWLGEQLQKSHALMQSVAQQQERIDERVEVLVEKRVAGVKAEMAGLRRRVDELEDALRAASVSASASGSGTFPHRRHSDDLDAGPPPPPSVHSKHPQSLLVQHQQQNGLGEGYTFPPVPPASSSSHHEPSSGSRLRHERPEPVRRLSSPGSGWGHRDQDRERDNASGSPAPGFDARRMSTSAARHESQQQRSVMQSPSQVFRERERERESRPQAVSRQNSTQSTGGPKGAAEREKERESSDRDASRRAGSRRNSVSMSPPEDES